MPSLHLVLQSGSDSILKKMNRKHEISLFLEKVNLLTKLNKDFTFTTDIIVGFPSETDEDFNQTKEIVSLVKFANTHIFPYSKRPNTVAAKFKEHIEQKTINDRKSSLVTFAGKKSFELREKFIGRKMKVLFESTKDDYFFGHTENNILVYVKKDFRIKSNLILDVFLKENKDSYILGELCE